MIYQYVHSCLEFCFLNETNHFVYFPRDKNILIIIFVFDIIQLVAVQIFYKKIMQKFVSNMKNCSQIFKKNNYFFFQRILYYLVDNRQPGQLFPTFSCCRVKLIEPFCQSSVFPQIFQWLNREWLNLNRDFASQIRAISINASVVLCTRTKLNISIALQKREWSELLVK